MGCCPGKGSEFGNGPNPEYSPCISEVRPRSEEMGRWSNADEQSMDKGKSAVFIHLGVDVFVCMYSASGDKNINLVNKTAMICDKLLCSP